MTTGAISQRHIHERADAILGELIRRGEGVRSGFRANMGHGEAEFSAAHLLTEMVEDRFLTHDEVRPGRKGGPERGEFATSYTYTCAAIRLLEYEGLVTVERARDAVPGPFNFLLSVSVTEGL